MEKRGFLAVWVTFILFIISCTASVKNKSTQATRPAERKKPTQSSSSKDPVNEKTSKTFSLNNRAGELVNYAKQKGYSTQYCFLIDMSLSSGLNRFFVYNLEKRSVAYSGLVAHGSCDERFLSRAKFSNVSNSGCSSLGKYKVGVSYHGKYGASFRLHGLENSNSNAFPRGVVMHAYDCVPDEEIYPRVLCNSLGCPMVSYNFFDRLSGIIKSSKKPILLWIYR